MMIKTEIDINNITKSEIIAVLAVYLSQNDGDAWLDKFKTVIDILNLSANGVDSSDSSKKDFFDDIVEENGTLKEVENDPAGLGMTSAKNFSDWDSL